MPLRRTRWRRCRIRGLAHRRAPLQSAQNRPADIEQLGLPLVLRTGEIAQMQATESEVDAEETAAGKKLGSTGPMPR
jgi:hypothetical protein